MSNYKRSKAKWQSEQEALNDVCKVQNTTPELLKAAHTKTHFQWTTEMEKPKKTEPADTNNGVFKVERISVESEKEAIEKAMYELDTFEGNLHRADTETHYVFSKVRG